MNPIFGHFYPIFGHFYLLIWSHGTVIQLTIKNSKCSSQNGLTDFGRTLISGNRPHVVIGFGCSGVALAIQPLSSGLNIPVVGAAVNSGLLTNKALFVRYQYSYDVTAQLAGAIAHSIGLRTVGAVATASFKTVESHLANALTL